MTEDILKATVESNPGSRKNDKSYWTPGLDTIEKEFSRDRDTAQKYPSTQNDKKLNKATEKLKHTLQTSKKGARLRS